MKINGTLEAVLKGKCPRCHEGSMFTKPLIKLSQMLTMHERCPHCDLSFEREPGFFYGAMYVSYAISVAIFAVTSILVFVLAGNPAINIYLISVALVAAILYPINFRYSRIFFMYLFGGVKYQPKD